MLVRPRHRGVHADIPGDQPGRIRAGLQACQDRRQVPSRCQRRNRPYTVCHGPYPGGTSRQGAPARTRHRIPSMSCRFVHFGGRPGFLPRGSSGSSTAHCASVRSARLLTVKVATRSPCRWSSWSLTHLPETSLIPGSATRRQLKITGYSADF